ncbi:MAG TPA: hypothetical protein VGY57_11540 [Vicinamibacterales bacterium]|nr:hypothetical protein [Vicinamibacterales bacterium]
MNEEQQRFVRSILRVMLRFVIVCAVLFVVVVFAVFALCAAMIVSK